MKRSDKKRFNKLAIIGGRDFINYELLKETMKSIECKTIISGGARGADSLGSIYAKTNGINFVLFKAEWDKYGKSAGFIRNELIINECDKVLAFWDGESKGTAHSIELAKKQKKPIEIVRY